MSGFRNSGTDRLSEPLRMIGGLGCLWKSREMSIKSKMGMLESIMTSSALCGSESPAECERKRERGAEGHKEAFRRKCRGSN